MNKGSNLKTAILYARAIYDGAEQDGQLSEAYEGAKRLLAAVGSDDNTLKQLDNPLWENETKIQIMLETVKKFDLCGSLINLLKLLIENRKFFDLVPILRQFILLYNDKHNIADIEVATVAPLSKTQEKKLKQKLAVLFQKDITLSYIIAPEIIGGLIIRYGTHLIDVSVKHKLDALEQLMKGTK